MSAAPLPAPSRIARLSSWFGSAEAVAAPRPAPATVHAISDTRGDATRRLCAAIGELLATHNLEPTIDHVGIIHHYVQRDDGRIVQAIDRRLAAGTPLDRAFLAGLAAPEAEDPLHPARIAAMADALVARLSESERAMRQGQASTRDYETALVAEVDALGSDDAAGTVERLLALTAAAVARTQQLADQLQRTHRETEGLRRNLQEAQRAADEDHLTGLPNRRCFDARLQETVRAAADAPDRCVAICDIDDFKAINDRHGHDAGDRVLKLIARQLTGALGAAALVARHGGEEFACLFTDCSVQEAADLLDDARDGIAARQLVNQASGEGIGRLTFSAGVAALHDDPGGAMRDADAALYLAKHAGKNRIVIAGSEQAHA